MSKLPKFKNNKEFGEYWEKNSVADHLDELEEVQEEVQILVPKPNKKQITLRIDADILEAIKEIARKKRIPYQTLINSYLGEITELKKAS